MARTFPALALFLILIGLLVNSSLRHNHLAAIAQARQLHTILLDSWQLALIRLYDRIGSLPIEKPAALLARLKQHDLPLPESNTDNPALWQLSKQRTVNLTLTRHGFDHCLTLDPLPTSIAIALEARIDTSAGDSPGGASSGDFRLLSPAPRHNRWPAPEKQPTVRTCLRLNFL